MTSFFSKLKFEKLSTKQKHKHASRLVQKLYELLLKKDPALSAHYSSYETLCFYLGIESPPISFEALSSRFHHHLKEAKIYRNEKDFLPQITTQDTSSKAPFLPIDIFLDNLRSAQNVGSIIRTTEAFRLGKLVLTKNTPDFAHQKVNAVSMGTSELVSSETFSCYEQLKKPIIALETSIDAISLYDFIFPPSFTLAIGNEEHGLSKSTLSQADLIIRIPLHGFKNSLNVASAFAITAGEIRRQTALLQQLNEP